MVLLYGEENFHQAEALLDRGERFFGLDTLGADMQGSAMRQAFLADYDKLFIAEDLRHSIHARCSHFLVCDVHGCCCNSFSFFRWIKNTDKSFPRRDSNKLAVSELID